MVSEKTGDGVDTRVMITKETRGFRLRFLGVCVLLVPDHENGFLQWLLFCEKHKVDGTIGSEKLDIPSDIAEILSHPEKWDSQAMKNFLDANKDLLESITRIGLLPSQSAAGIDVDRWSFVGARFTKQCTELLLADARLAAEAGDFERALRQVKAASGLANHYSQIENPNRNRQSTALAFAASGHTQFTYTAWALDESTTGWPNHFW